MPKTGTPASKSARSSGRGALRVHGRGAAGEDDRRRVLGEHLGDRHGGRHDLAVDPGLADAAGDELGVLRAEVDDEDDVGSGAAGDADGTGRPSGGERGRVRPILPGAARGHGARRDRRPGLTIRTGLARARRSTCILPVMHTQPTFLFTYGTGPPAAMVVLLEQLTSDFPGAPGRQGPGRLSFSGPCRSGATRPHRGAPP